MLIQLDSKLDKSKMSEQILIDKRGFYFYYNIPTENTKVVKVHVHSCGHCAWGSGKRRKKEIGEKGTWIGPFENFQQAKAFATAKLNITASFIEACACIPS